jgi:hemerythrin superfamily protein
MHPVARHQHRSLFEVAGAAAVGVVAGLALNPLRKFALQHAEAAVAGDWDEVLKLEHRAVDVLFNLLEQTKDKDAAKRTLLLSKIAYALNKHAIQEENVVYPALREEDRPSAEHLAAEHAEIKAYIFELERMDKGDPQWLAKVKDFHALIARHVEQEEAEAFPKMKASLSAEENDALGRSMHVEGMKLA